MMAILQSVGAGGHNSKQDVSLIQLMLNEWRAQNVLQPIAVDGLSGQETIRAIRLFQEKETHIIDGRIDPHGPAWAALLLAYDKSVRSFIVSNSRVILTDFDNNVRATGVPLPQKVQSGMSTVRSSIAALGPPVARANLGGSRLLLGFLARPPVFGAIALAPPLIVLVFAMFALLFLMSVIVAKPALERLAKELAILMNKIADIIKGFIQELRDAAKRDIKQFQKCQNPFDAAINLAIKILLDIDAVGRIDPGNTLARERAVRSIAAEIQKLLALMNDFFRCMNLPPLGPLLPPTG